MTATITDTEAYVKHSTHSWVYHTTQLLDLQNISWRPFEHAPHTQPLPVFGTEPESHSCVWIEPLDGKSLMVTAAVVKGVPKWHCVHLPDGTVSDSSPGDLTLRVTGFCALYLKKYTGMITMSITGTVLTAVKLRAVPELCQSLPESVQQHISDFSTHGVCRF